MAINGPAQKCKMLFTEDGQTQYDGDGDAIIVMPPPNNSNPDAGDIGVPDAYPQTIVVKGGGGLQGPLQQNVAQAQYTAQLSGTNWTTTGMTYSWFDNLTGTTAWGTYGQGFNITGGPWTYSAGLGTFPVSYIGVALNKDGSVATKGDTGQTTHVHISVTDGSGVTATGNYYMTVHRGQELSPSKRSEYETGQYGTTQKFAYIPATIRQYLSTPQFPSSRTNECRVSIRYPNYGYAALDAGISIVQVFADFFDAGPEAQAVLEAGGFTVDKLEPSESNCDCDFSICYGMPLNSKGQGMPVSNYMIQNKLISDYTANAARVDSYRNQLFMMPHVELAYIPTWQLVDHYNNAGFVDETKEACFTATPYQGYAWGQFVDWDPNAN